MFTERKRYARKLEKSQNVVLCCSYHAKAAVQGKAQNKAKGNGLGMELFWFENNREREEVHNWTESI